MKYLLILTIFFCSKSYASWSQTETTLFTTYCVLNVIDLGQSIYSYHEGHNELNPIFKQPAQMVIAKVTGTLTLYYIIRRMNYKYIPLTVLLIMQSYAVLHNATYVELNLRFEL